LYLWSAGYYFDNLGTFTSKYFIDISSISVYEENLKSFEQAVGMASELKQIHYHSNCQVEYVLQNSSSWFAANSTRTKITRPLNSAYSFSHDNIGLSGNVCEWKTVHIHNCLVCDTGVQSCFMKQETTLHFYEFNIKFSQYH